jgi:hypothetical protein
MGEAARRGLGYLADAADAAALATAYKDARNAVAHQAAVEGAVLRSAAALFPDPAAAEKAIAKLQPSIDARVAALQSEITSAYRLQADRRRLPPTEPPLTEAERQPGAGAHDASAGPWRHPGRAAEAHRRGSAWVEPALTKLPDTMFTGFMKLTERARKPFSRLLTVAKYCISSAKPQ